MQYNDQPWNQRQDYPKLNQLLLSKLMFANRDDVQNAIIICPDAILDVEIMVVICVIGL